MADDPAAIIRDLSDRVRRLEGEASGCSRLVGEIQLGGGNPTSYFARVETSGTKLRLYRGDASAALAGATLTANSTIELTGWMELA